MSNESENSTPKLRGGSSDSASGELIPTAELPPHLRPNPPPYPNKYQQPHPNPAPGPDAPDLVTGSFADLLFALSIREWDAVVVCDGSGSGWDIGCGWASVVTMRTLRRSPLLVGGFNYGTVNVAETMAPYQALMWLDVHAASALKKAKGGGFLDVHVITDSELVVRQGSLRAACSGPNRTIWRAIRDYEREGWRLHFHWYPRDRIQLNMLCDHGSRQARLALQGMTVGSLIGAEFSEYSFNPIAPKKDR